MGRVVAEAAGIVRELGAGRMIFFRTFSQSVAVPGPEMLHLSPRQKSLP